MLSRFSPHPDLRYAQVVSSRSISEGCSQNGRGESPSLFIGEGLGMGSVYNILVPPYEMVCEGKWCVSNLLEKFRVACCVFRFEVSTQHVTRYILQHHKVNKIHLNEFST